MGWGLRMDILEREYLLIHIHLFGGNRSLDNFAKQAIGRHAR
jgi:hypothetical protein